MAMVFCRGCGKEIHETAPTCPLCGAPQGLQSSAPPSRNVGLLIIIALGFALAMWLGFLVLGGFIIGFMNPDDASNAGEAFGQATGAPALLISLILSAVLTTIGLLPGTRKK